MRTFVESNQSGTFVTNSTNPQNGDLDRTRVNVQWDPTRMHVSANGCHISPAMGLEHELDHARGRVEDFDATTLRRQTRAGQYDNAEEKRVIEGFDRPTAQLLRAEELRLGSSRTLPPIERTAHDGAMRYWVDEVKSYSPLMSAEIDGGKRAPLRQPFEQSGKLLGVSHTHALQDMGGGHKIRYPVAELLSSGVDMKALKAAIDTSVTIAIRDGKFEQSITPVQATSLGHGQ